MPCSDLVTQLSGSIAGGVVGFAAAYVMSWRVRRWDAEDAAAAARAALIQAARVPLEIIRDEFRANQALYYTGEVEDRISRALREAIYGLRDDQLCRTFEQAVPALRQLATSIGSDRKSAGEKCMPRIEAMLARLGETEKIGGKRLL